MFPDSFLKIQDWYCSVRYSIRHIHHERAPAQKRVDQWRIRERFHLRLERLQPGQLSLYARRDVRLAARCMAELVRPGFRPSGVKALFFILYTQVSIADLAAGTPFARAGFISRPKTWFFRTIKRRSPTNSCCLKQLGGRHLLHL